MMNTGMLIFRSNFRFIARNFPMNLFKAALTCAGVMIAGYFYGNSFYQGSFQVKPFVIAVSITVLVCLVYVVLQRFSLKVRTQEIFIRKWYGGRSADIFLLVLTDHLVVVATSILLSLLVIDILSVSYSLSLFAAGVLKVTDLYIYGALQFVILIIAGAVSVKKLSRSKIPELLIKIS